MRKEFLSISFLLVALVSCKKDNTLLKETISNEVLSAKSGGGYRVNLSKDLLAYFPFDGNANDASGNGYNGILSTSYYTAPTLTSDRFGRKNRAYLFSNNFITTNIGNQYFQGDFSISLWMQIDEFLSNYPQLIVGENYYLAFGLTNTTNPPVLTFCFNPYPNSIGCFTSPINYNKWSNVVLTSHNYYTKLFIDGTYILTAQDQSIGQGATYGTFLKIGAGFQMPQESFVGKIDEVRFYTRELNQSEITYLAKN